MGICHLRALQLAFICCLPCSLFSQTSSGSLTLGPYGDCAAPAQEGLNVCVPGTGFEVPSPFQVIVAATSGRAQVNHIEMWADGKKITQTTGTPFDEPITLPPGTHKLTAIAVNTLGSYVKSTPFTVTVLPSESPSCPPPGAPGVNVCAPTGDCNTSPWVNIVATGRGQSGTVQRMELWNGQTKLANFIGDRINTNLIMLFGTITIYEIDSKGASKSTSFPYYGPC